MNKRKSRQGFPRVSEAGGDAGIRGEGIRACEGECCGRLRGWGIAGVLHGGGTRSDAASPTLLPHLHYRGTQGILGSFD